MVAKNLWPGARRITPEGEREAGRHILLRNFILLARVVPDCRRQGENVSRDDLCPTRESRRGLRVSEGSRRSSRSSELLHGEIWSGITAGIYTPSTERNR